MGPEKLSKARRLEALHTLLTEIAFGLRNAREGILDSEGSANTVHLVADFLSQLGWMADQGCAIAGDTCPQVVGDAHAWLLSPYLQGLLRLNGKKA